MGARTHAAGAVTSRDVDLVRRISAMAARAGATSRPTSPQADEIAIDTTDVDRIRPFWTAVLAYVDDGRVLVDPLRIGPHPTLSESGAIQRSAASLGTVAREDRPRTTELYWVPVPADEFFELAPAWRVVSSSSR